MDALISLLETLSSVISWKTELIQRGTIYKIPLKGHINDTISALYKIQDNADEYKKKDIEDPITVSIELNWEQYPSKTARGYVCLHWNIAEPAELYEAYMSGNSVTLDQLMSIITQA